MEGTTQDQPSSAPSNATGQGAPNPAPHPPVPSGGPTAGGGTSANPAPASAQGELKPSGDFTPEQTRQMLEWAVQDGRLTPEQAKALAEKDGLAFDSASQKTDNPVAAELDMAFPKARPQDFDLPPLTKDSAQLTPEALKWDQTRRTWLSTAGVTKEIGSMIGNTVEKVSQNFQKMNPAERALWTQGERARVQAIFGEKTGEYITLAQQLIQEIDAKSPGLKAYLENTGATNSADVVVNVINHALRLRDRAQARKGN